MKHVNAVHSLRRVRSVVATSLRLGMAMVLGLVLLRTHGAAPESGPGQVAKLLPHLRHVQHRLDTGAGSQMQRLFPEGLVFSHALTALAWTELVVDLPRSDPRRLEGVAAVRRALDIIESEEGRAPFSPYMNPPYGVFWSGWRTQVRAGLVWLEPEDAIAARQLEADCHALAAAFDASSTPFLDSYPGQSWPADSVVAVSALPLCEALLGVDHDATLSRWRAGANGRVGPEGVLSFSTYSDVARGTSTALMARFLHRVDPALGLRHYEVLRTRFLTTRGGLPAVQEFADGNGLGDVDSGPLILGVSLAATVVGAGSARLYGDERLAQSIHGLGEGLGLAVPSWHGRTWAFGLLPLGEAFVLWSRTTRPWLEEPPQVREPASVPAWWWRLPWEGTGWLLVLALLAWELRTRSMLVHQGR